MAVVSSQRGDPMATQVDVDVAVIGSGFFAAALAINLLDRLPPTVTFGLVGPRVRPARGIAYATEFDGHLLNVPAGRMSLFPDLPEHFTDWLSRCAPSSGPEDYVPRRLY